MGTIYLAGPIECVSLDSAADWRTEAAYMLADEMGHVVCDPNLTWTTSKEARANLTPRECETIVYGDLNMVSAVDALIVLTDKDTLMCGTYVETGWALAHNKVIAFYSPTARLPGFVVGLREAASAISRSRVEIFTDIRQACNWVSALIKDGA